MTVFDRYTISSIESGLIDTASKKDEAFEIAQTAVQEWPQVTVFDLMAHKGRPHEWLPSGYIVCTRDRRCPDIPYDEPKGGDNGKKQMR